MGSVRTYIRKKAHSCSRDRALGISASLPGRRVIHAISFTVNSDIVTYVIIITSIIFIIGILTKLITIIIILLFIITPFSVIRIIIINIDHIYEGNSYVYYSRDYYIDIVMISY